MQLLSFLITAKAPQDYGGDVNVTHSHAEIQKMKIQSMQFQCDGCNHKFSKPYPAPQSPIISIPQSDNKMVLNTKLNDNKRNIIDSNYIGNNNSNWIICGPSINNQKGKQDRGRRTRKRKNDQTRNTMTKIEE